MGKWEILNGCFPPLYGAAQSTPIWPVIQGISLRKMLSHNLTCKHISKHLTLNHTSHTVGKDGRRNDSRWLNIQTPSHHLLKSRQNMCKSIYLIFFFSNSPSDGFFLLTEPLYLVKKLRNVLNRFYIVECNSFNYTASSSSALEDERCEIVTFSEPTVQSQVNWANWTTVKKIHFQFLILRLLKSAFKDSLEIANYKAGSL